MHNTVPSLGRLDRCRGRNGINGRFIFLIVTRSKQNKHRSYAGVTACTRYQNDNFIHCRVDFNYTHRRLINNYAVFGYIDNVVCEIAVLPFRRVKYILITVKCLNHGKHLINCFAVLRDYCCSVVFV